MTNKIIEVLAKILEGLNKNYSFEEVNSLLNDNKDFDKTTVSVAFSLVYDKVLTNKLKRQSKRNRTSKKIRLLTDEEKEVIGMDNYNYLIHLMNVGLLQSEDLEMIIEQIMLYPKEAVDRDDINWIILISLVDFSSEILPGSRVLLYSSDTIN